MNARRFYTMMFTLISMTFVIVACSDSDLSQDPTAIKAALVGKWRNEENSCEAIFYENDKVLFTSSQGSRLYLFRLREDESLGVILELENGEDLTFGVGENYLSIYFPGELSGDSMECVSLERVVE